MNPYFYFIDASIENMLMNTDMKRLDSEYLDAYITNACDILLESHIIDRLVSIGNTYLDSMEEYGDGSLTYTVAHTSCEEMGEEV